MTARLSITRKDMDRLADRNTTLGTPAPFGAADIGAPTIAAQVLADNGKADLGVAEITSGSWPVVNRPSPEVLVLLAGDLRISPEGEDSYLLSPGDLVVFPAGWTGRFSCEQAARFVFVHPSH
jgi:uncharacterized cupin superfamily protein